VRIIDVRERPIGTSRLRSHITVPHHYAFTGGWLGDRLITKSDPDPQHFLDAVRRLAPGSATRVLRPGEPLTMTSANVTGAAPDSGR
jgi:hypothetical protein